MNYRHSYHAGNFADVFKHVLLIALVQSFLRKDKPFCYLETHAGAGSYDLFSSNPKKSGEYQNGILKILSAENPPELIQDYLSCIKKLNPSKQIRYYPGSPYCALQFLRPIDRMILSELHSEDFNILKKYLGMHQQIAFYHQNGYQSLKAFLPPKERRGLILIDPPYEEPDEFSNLLKLLPEALKRFETGVYTLWYPIKNQATTNRFIESLKTKIQSPMLTAELCMYPTDVTLNLNGSGLLIINPPWQFDELLKNILPWLWEILSVNQQGGWEIKNLI